MLLVILHIQVYIQIRIQLHTHSKTEEINDVTLHHGARVTCSMRWTTTEGHWRERGWCRVVVIWHTYDTHAWCSHAGSNVCSGGEWVSAGCMKRIVFLGVDEAWKNDATSPCCGRTTENYGRTTVLWKKTEGA